MGRTKILRDLHMEAWLTKDKISRFRGILKLHAREKKLQQFQATKLKSAISRKLALLVLDVEADRKIVKDLIEGGKQRALKSLSEYKEFYLALNRLQPSEIYEAVFQDSNLKGRLLDKLYFKKKQKLKQALALEMERSTLSIIVEEQLENFLGCEQQRLIVRLQQSITKYNTAKTVHFTYCSMLNILRKDAMFFDNLLDILKENQFSQCKAMLRVTMMGQLVTENLDDIKQKYKRMTRIILRNMKIREQMLSSVRLQVEDLWAFAQSLVRVESETAFVKKETVEETTERLIETQIKQLNETCNKLKDIFLVRYCHDLLPRLENQANQRTALLERLDVNLKNRDLLLNKKNQAVFILEHLMHTVKPTAEQHKQNVQEMLAQLETEKKREKDMKEEKKIQGKLLANVRAALYNLSTVLHSVQKTGGPAKQIKKPTKETKDAKEKHVDIDKEGLNEEQLKLLELEEGEENVLMMLMKITRKIAFLYNIICNFDLEAHAVTAQDLYENYVANYNSNLIYLIEEEPIELLVEHEIFDITVPTRTDIKLHSKQIVEVHLKPE